MCANILEAIAAIERYANRDKKTFEKDELVQTCFLRHLQIIGEAARALPEEVRALAPEVPWHKITGMRNVLVHGYFEIDADLVWDAVTRDVAGLKAAIQSLVTALKRGKK